MKIKPSFVHTFLGVVVGLVLFLLTFGVEQYYRYHVSNLRSLDGKEHSYYIYPDMSLDSVLNRIRENYDISGELDLRWHMRLRVFTEPKPGYYVFPAEMGDKLFISKLQTGDQTPIQLKWTNMARTREDLAGVVASQLMLDSVDIIERLSSDEYMGEYGLTAENSRCLFIPNTYEVYWTITPDELFKRMDREYRAFWTEERRAKAEAQGLTPVDVAIIASIVECETYVLKDMPTVASLYINRYHKGMRLQACPTVIYAVGDFSIRRVLKSHLKVESPYNTYQNNGLPPGPIRCPLPRTMDYVLDAPKTDYLYMCAHPSMNGTHIFSSSYGTHSSAARDYQRMMNQKHIK
jgi:UPF0755 protein